MKYVDPIRGLRSAFGFKISTIHSRYLAVNLVAYELGLFPFFPVLKLFFVQINKLFVFLF